MNPWVEKSINLVKEKGYLDRLLEVYPPEEISRGRIVEKESPHLRELFEKRKCEELIKELINLKKKGFKFPIEHPYISFLSYFKEAIDKNPQTIKKICEQLFKMDYDQLKEELEAPKKASRRIGPMFKKWLRKKFKFVDVKEFDNISKEIVFLKGGDKLLKKYAEENLKCEFKEYSKGLDFVIKKGDKYIIGTAKFITALGGSQTNQFNEAITFLKETKVQKNIIKIAIIDGIPWLAEKMKITLKKLKTDEFCFSVLLLEEFLKKEF
ncbi:MAG: hypothetical protein QXO40_05395 [Candidatus Aenigmatarchaeota archaeon]